MNFSSKVLLLLLIGFISCGQDDQVISLVGNELLPSSFTGIDFKNTLIDDATSTNNLLSFGYYNHGSGVGMGDFDNDGLTDLVFAGNEVNNRIYKNLGDLKFEDKTENSNINVHRKWSTGISIVDINNDHLLDIYISQGGPQDDRRNCFYLNKGNFVFEEISERIKVNDDGFSTQAVFLDYDNDGDLDIYVMNESPYEGESIGFIEEKLKDKNNLKRSSGNLYRNEGNMNFSNATESANLLDHSFGLGVLVTDFNNDNLPDIYVANDYSVPDRMYINQGDGTFKDQIKQFTNSISYFSMGCDAADINNDGYIDLGVVDMATADHFRGKTLMASMDSELFNQNVKTMKYQYQYMFNAFQLNNGHDTYSNIAGYLGLQKTDWSWAALLADFDLNGYKDYFVGNGNKRYQMDNDFQNLKDKVRRQNGGFVPVEMRKELYDKMPTIPLRNLIYMNKGDLQFEENPIDFNYPESETFSYGTAYGDLDNDGDLELVVSNIDEEVHIIKNNSVEHKKGNFLNIKLAHPKNSATCYNSKVRITYEDGVQIAEYAFTRGYLSSMDQTVYFGLGDITKISKLEILWSDNNYQVIENPKINQLLLVEYTKGRQTNSLPEIHKKVVTLNELSSQELGITYSHVENEFEDFAKEVLLPQKQSTLGPSVTAMDLNKDGLTDLFFGGAATQPAELYMQNKTGQFERVLSPALDFDKNTEDMEAVAVDPNQDGIPELFTASGGGGDMEGEDILLQDRFYIYDGKTLQKADGVAPSVGESTYKVKAIDLDGDGVQEIIQLGSAKPGKYPFSEPNHLLKFQDNKYIDITAEIIPGLSTIPLARDASFLDVNNDDKMDIMVVSEWGTPTLFVSSDHEYKDKTNEFFKEDKFGWWSSITPIDIDNDGDLDFILGNMGKNLKHKVSNQKPLYLYANDFDKNGTIDVVLAKEYKGKIVPARGRECSSQQMPFIEKKFETYTEFANADIVDILGAKSVEESSKYKATSFGSYLLRNNNGTFEYELLPSYAQTAPILSSVVIDINQDGYDDVIVAGNYYDTEYETPRQDAGRGIVLLNQKGKGFRALMPFESGLDLNGNFRKIILIQRENDKLLLATQNNGAPKIYLIE